MPTTCPHCGTRSPAMSGSCTGCGSGVRRLSETDAVPALWLNFPTRVWMWIAMGAAIMLLGAGASTGFLFDGDENDHASGERISKDELPDAAISVKPEPSAKSPSSSPKPSKKPQTSPSPSEVKPSPSKPPKPAPTSKPPSDGLPSGFRRVTDDLGFSLGVMEGWQRRPLGDTHVDYVPPTGQEVLRLSAVPSSGRSTLSTFQETEKQLSNDPSYERIRLEENTFQGRPGARWEFKWTNDAGETVRAIDQGYVASDGMEYTIYFEARERLFDGLVFDTALNSWKLR